MIFIYCGKDTRTHTHILNIATHSQNCVQREFRGRGEKGYTITTTKKHIHRENICYAHYLNINIQEINFRIDVGQHANER